MMLSPRSCGRMHRQKRQLGCCKECKSAINRRNRPENFDKPHPVKFATANGLMIGSAPKWFQKSNDVELALLSKGRCEKHMFSFSAGNAKSMVGWHTICNNDVTCNNAVLNHFQENRQNSDVDSESNDSNASEDKMFPDDASDHSQIDCDGHGCSEEESDPLF